jgi:subtilisin-like proprotein convertase family protein
LGVKIVLVQVFKFLFEWRIAMCKKLLVLIPFVLVVGLVGARAVRAEQLSAVEAAKDPIPADGAVGVSYLPTIGTYDSNDVPKDIPDFSATTGKNVLGEVTSTLNVPGAVTITDLNVELDISKTGNNADLNVFLTSPDGKQVKLFADVGLGKDDFKNTILDDQASQSISHVTGSMTGIFKPEGKLSDFNGRNAKGTWKLKIQDDWYGGKGTLNAWRLVITSPAVVRWTPSSDAAAQDVYFADNFEDVNSSAASALVGNLSADAASAEIGPLAMGQTYYWRVDTITADGSVGVGDIWSFTTASGNVEVNVRVGAGDDDAEQVLPAGNMDITSSNLEMPYQNTGMGNLQIVGMRFANVGISRWAQPKTATSPPTC